jgi:hypothetical protein
MTTARAVYGRSIRSSAQRIDIVEGDQREGTCAADLVSNEPNMIEPAMPTSDMTEASAAADVGA